MLLPSGFKNHVVVSGILDIPPLEDMTEVLKQADAIRESRLDAVIGNNKSAKASSAKERARVKKNVTARSVPPEKVEDNAAKGDHKDKQSTAATESGTTSHSSTPAASSAPQSTNGSSKAAKKPAASSGGMFGGMKKGFLFGGPSKGPSSASKTKSSDTPVQAIPVEKKEATAKTEKKDEIPYISPKTGKTESGLTLDEVQQAMSETKGLLDNQDWINDDLLNKVEKNELLLKRFADPQFMKALEEFQTNPIAAMEKYKGNKEVEKFLTEFCGLLGDHFTKFGSSPATAAGATSTAKATPAASKASKPSKPVPKISEVSQKQPQQPKIVEITDRAADHKGSESAQTDQKSPKIVEITDSEPSSGLTELKTPDSLSSSRVKAPEIRTASSTGGADIQEVPPMEDAKVKEMLQDSKVMEHLLDPGIMNLIQTLKTDPRKAQRLVDTADRDLKEKISFLVSKGLLQFQAG